MACIGPSFEYRLALELQHYNTITREVHMVQGVLEVYGMYSDDAILGPVAGDFVEYSRHERKAVRMASAMLKAIEKANFL